MLRLTPSRPTEIGDNISAHTLIFDEATALLGIFKLKKISDGNGYV
jgi:hypothetical protein